MRLTVTTLLVEEVRSPVKRQRAVRIEIDRVIVLAAADSGLAPLSSHHDLIQTGRRNRKVFPLSMQASDYIVIYFGRPRVAALIGRLFSGN